MIAQGKSNSSIITLDSEMQVKNTSEMDCIISQLANHLYDERYLFALNAEQNLIAIDLSLCNKGISPY